MSAEAPVAPMMNAKLRVDHVSMVFNRDGKSTPVLDDINLEVQRWGVYLPSRPFGLRKIDPS